MNEDVAFIEEQVDRHHEWFSRSLPMIASENVISPLARELLLSDFGDRYAEGLPGERYYQGNTFVDEVERRVVDLAQKLFRCRLADVRPISGTVANLAVYYALLEPGDIMTSVALSHGAHISSARFGAAGMRGVNNVNYPFDVERMNLDVDGTARLLTQVKPRVAMFGQSVFLFPAPLKELRDAFQEAGCQVWYDGAHVMGLIAGGLFQDPLREARSTRTSRTRRRADTAWVKPGGGRVGTRGSTRLGMREAQMAEVAALMARVAIKKEDPVRVAKDVAELRKEFNTVHYCFQP